jgi:hypothetical protein
MIILLNVGRLLMVIWIVYSLVLTFAPQFLHQQPNRFSGLIQCVCAYAVGYLLDRMLSKVRRQKAAENESAAPEHPTI